MNEWKEMGGFDGRNKKDEMKREENELFGEREKRDKL